MKGTTLRQCTTSIFTHVILVEHCKPVTFERRPKLEKVTCPKFLNGCVSGNELTIFIRSIYHNDA